MKKKIVSLLLSLCMLLSVLPGPAYAAVGELMRNTPAQNESLLEQLEGFTGETYGEAYELLSTLGLLDEDGNLVTDRTIDLDGKSYTLEEMEALLKDASTDLAQVAEVDGVPISLSDLKTVIAIEQELQYLQEKYFSGAAFTGEALENVNSLMAQLQSEGMTLGSTGNLVVFDQEGTDDSVDGYSPGGYICASNVALQEGDTYQVKFKLAIPEAIRVLGEDMTIKVCFDTELYSHKPLAAVEIPIREALADPDKEYTLSYTVDSSQVGNFASKLYLHAAYKRAILGSDITLEHLWRYYTDYSMGTAWGGVSFYDPEGFVFGDGSGKIKDTWNCFFDYQLTMPQLEDSWTQGDGEREYVNSAGVGAVYFYISDGGETYRALDATLTYLQKCKTDQSLDNWQRFHVDATLRQTNPKNHNLMTSLGLLQNANYKPDDPESLSHRFAVDVNSVKGFPLNLPSGSQTTTVSFDAYMDHQSDSVGLQYLPAYFTAPYGKDTTVTEPGSSLENIYTDTKGAAGYVSKASVTLVDDGNSPKLTLTAPAGTYQTGDLIPIDIYADEYIEAKNAKITINGTEYNLSDLHATSNGKFLSLLYEVQEFDAAGLTVAISNQSGIADFFGNPASEKLDTDGLSGVKLQSGLLKNAVTGLSASYDETSGAVTFDIAVSQHEKYQQIYSQYQNDKTGAMQLLISVDGAEEKAHTVTMGGSGNTYTFTAEPYTVERTTAEQTVTAKLQVKNGSEWVTVGRLSTQTTVPALVPVTKVTVSVPDGWDTNLALTDQDFPKLEAKIEPGDATYKTGTWHSSDETIAAIDETGQIKLTGKAVGTVKFWYVADNGTEETTDDITSNELEFTVTAGNQLNLEFPKYAQDSLIRGGSDATVEWITNALVFYPGQDITFTVNLYAGTEAAGEVLYTDSVTNDTRLTIPAEYLTADYPQSQYTVTVSMEKPEARSAQTVLTVLAPPTELRVSAERTDLTDGQTLTLQCTISNKSARGTLSAIRMTEGASEAVSASSCLSGKDLTNGGGTITFTPGKVTSGLYDTYTITFTETGTASEHFAPSSDSLVLHVYRSGALEIANDGPIQLDNTQKVSGNLPTDSQEILALRQELGLIEYVSINADDYNWSSFSDGIRWASDHPEAVGVYYRQGGLWDNIEDLPYETYLPQTKMAVSATADGTATITATHAATGMSDSVTVNVNTLRDKFYLFQVTPAEKTEVRYTDGKGQAKTVYTNDEGVLALYEPNTIASDVNLRSGTDAEPYLGTIALSALTSGERDAAKLQLYPLNTITLVPAAKAELYLVKPDGTPYVGNVTLRGGVYLAGYYCEGVQMGATPSLIPGNQDGTYKTDADGKLTVYMDATQFQAEGYTGQLTNAALDYWFELRDLDGNRYYPQLVNIQGSMSANRILRTGSAVVRLEEVPAGQENQPYLTAQTLSYGKEGPEDVQVRNVLDSTGKVGPNSTYQYSALTSYFMLWGVNADNGKATVSMTGDNGFAPEGQTVDDSTFPFASIPVVTNTLVLTKETMTESGWLQPETAATLRASVYQNGQLLKNVTMPFQVIDLTDVKLVNEDAQAVVLDMQGRFMAGLGGGGSAFTFGDNSVGSAFSGKITDLLNKVQETGSPMFRVLITPSEDNTVFNVLVWGGYDSLDLKDFEHTGSGVSMDYELLDAELNVGVPGVGDLTSMAQGTYDPIGAVNETKYNRTNSGLDLGAQLEGYYEGQFYYDTDQHQWAFRTLGGGMTAGAGVSFDANLNAWVGPIPITASFGAGLALQLDFKAATVYTDQQSAATLSTWTDDARASESVNDFLTTLRINGYVNAFGGIGFDYSVLALKIGLFGKLTGDSSNTFLSRTYLKEKSQINGQALGVTGEVGIKFVAKFLFISYETVLGSGRVSYDKTFNDYTYINDYWTGGGGSNLRMGTATLLSRDYLRYYANGQRSWTTPGFDTTATVVQNDANPGSEPVVNDDGSLSVYISDMDSPDYFASRIKAGGVGQDGKVIDDNGFGDLSPSLSGSSAFTAAAWVRLQENLEKEDGQEVTPAEQQRLLNSTEIMAAVTTDGGDGWTVRQLTDNATPDLAPVTASNGSHAIVFWRSVYASDETALTSFDTQDAICFSRYDGSDWTEARMLYNGSIGGVVGIQTAMLSDGTALVAFTVDRDPDNGDSSDCEVAYRTVAPDGTMGDLVVLTNDSETDANPQVTAVTDGGTPYFVLGWYSGRDGGDIRLQAVGADGQLYGGGSQYAVPDSVSAISGADGLRVSAEFRFARRTPGSSLDGLTLVWAETANNQNGEADHSVLYGARLCRIDDAVYLSSPQSLVNLPARTLANAFSAWQDGSGKVNAYLFGTWYSDTETETVPGYDTPVAKDADQLLTGGGAFKAHAVSVESIVVDYANLQANAFTPVTFTLRNTGTAKLTGLTVNVGSASAKVGDLYPGQTATAAVQYKTGDTIVNPDYTITANGGTQVDGGKLHLDYNDVGISSIKVVEEQAGKRTVLMTLYNDSAALLEGSGRTVALRFYTDAEYSEAANVTLTGTPDGVTVSGNTITISGDAALRRMDQGSMTLLVTYDLASYVTGTMQQKEVPESGVYLYAVSEVREGGKAMAEYATGNNETAVSLTGAYARTGEQTTLDVTITNSDVTKATVTLKNNSLQAQPDRGTLLAVLLDGSGNALETKTVLPDSALTCEETRTMDVSFTKLGADVMVLYAAGGTGLQELRFSGIPVALEDFVENPEKPGEYVYTLEGEAPASTVVSFLSSEAVTVNGTAYGKADSVELSIPGGSSTITVTSGGSTYVLNLSRADTGSSGYAITVEPAKNGTMTASRSRAGAGTTVTLTAAPKDGYRLVQLTVTGRNGTAVPVTSKGSGKYTFNMPTGSVTVTAAFLPFTDVTMGAWYVDGLCYVYENGLMGGTGSTTFSPDGTTTRGMIATILWRMEGSPAAKGQTAFADVDPASWYGEAVRWAAEQGIVSGYGDDRFGPDDPITREQMAAMLYRYAQYKEYDVSVGEDTNLLSYTDFDQLGEWAIPAMQWACGAGIINGTGAGTLNPRGSATRAQVAVILMRYREDLAQ